MLIVFIKYPEPGKTKTRLIPALGSIAAADLQHTMSQHVLKVVKEFCQAARRESDIRFTGATDDQMADLYGTEWRYREQGDGDLGERLTRSVTDGFLSGAKAVVVIGTDCPTLTADHLQIAFDWLLETDVVLGPALDGGYYLIGLRQPHAELFKGISWSTECVLQQTVQAASHMGLSVRLLEYLADIDKPEDLPGFIALG